jgi:hypothetical protein
VLDVGTSPGPLLRKQRGERMSQVSLAEAQGPIDNLIFSSIIRKSDTTSRVSQVLDFMASWRNKTVTNWSARYFLFVCFGVGF